MSSIVIRNIPAETHRALKSLAMQHGRSTESEIRDILEIATFPEKRLKLGSALTEFGKRYGPLEFTREQEL